MTEEDRIEISNLTQRLDEINTQIKELKKTNPNFYPESLIKELSEISNKIINYGNTK